MLVSSTRFNLARCKSVCATVQSDQSLSFPSELAIHRAHIKDSDAQGNLSLRWAHITASNLCLLLQKEQNVKGGEGPSGKQAVGINNGTRIARQLNYQRTLTSATTAIINIPGLSCEAFDQGGSHVRPWSIIQLMYSAYRCFANPETTSSDTLQQKSFADLHLLTESFHFYMVSIDMKFSKYLYSEQSPKYPLSIHIELDNVGKSSRRCTHRLYHKDVGVDYASFICTDVLVSQETKKPVPYPDWWINKFSPLCKNDRQAKFALPQDRLQNPCKTSTVVNLSDTDIYKHTNTGCYLKFCCESIFRNISRNAYKNINQKHFDSGVKSVNLVLAGQSVVDDELDIITWEDSMDNNIMYGQIVKREGDICCYMKIEFYNDNTQPQL